MQWERLTAREFEQAVGSTGVCVLNMSVIEKHGEHLPLGTDMFLGHRLACLAAEKEPAVVFPPYYFGKVYEATCFPGAVAVSPSLLINLAQDVFKEIGRNGFSKILLFNSHGGNTALLNFLTQCDIAFSNSYTLYLVQDPIPHELREVHEKICAIPQWEHAGTIETSLMMALYPDLTSGGMVPHTGAVPIDRLAHLGRLVTGVDWYADFPDHYAGDASVARPDIGRALLPLYVDSLAAQISAVKSDTVAPTMKAEFLARAGVRRFWK